MSTGTRIVLLIIVLPIVATFVWSLLRESRVRIPSGSLGLLVVRGKPTDKALLPGAHWVPSLRKRQAVQYPAVELSYRATHSDSGSESPVEAFGPALRVFLGDRAEVRVGYTVRFRLDPAHLRTVHERFGPEGIWAVVRDDSAAAITAALADPQCSLDTFFGPGRGVLEQGLRAAVAEALTDDGMILTSFTLGAIDLGRHGDAIQATVRARLELEQEEAEAATRMARVRHDAELAPYLVGVGDAALRYRQTDVWRDLVHRPDGLTLAVPGPVAGAPLPGAEPEQPQPAGPPPETQAP